MVFIKKLLLGFLLCGLLAAFFLTPQKANAVSLTLQSNQTTLNQDEEYNVNITLSISVANGTQYFLRGAFYQQGAGSYCGFTFNGIDWYNGPYTTNSGWTHLLPITVQNSSWSGTLKAKLDTGDSACASSGTYNFKVQRYTNTSSNTNIGTFDAQNEQTIEVTIPTATPAPTPTNSPTSTPVPTNTPKPTLLPTSKPTATKSPTFAIASLSAESSDSGILGASTTAEPTLVEGISETQGRTVNWVALFLVVGGIFVLSSCGILFYYQRKKGTLVFWKTHEDPNDKF